MKAAGERPALHATRSEVEEHAPLVGRVCAAAVQDAAVEDGDVAPLEGGDRGRGGLDELLLLALGGVPEDVSLGGVRLGEERGVAHVVLHVLEGDEERVERIGRDVGVLGAREVDGIGVDALPAEEAMGVP